MTTTTASSTLPRAVWVLTALVALVLSGTSSARAQTSFINFESGQVRPLALSPDGNRLFAANTPDNRLEIFSVGAGGLTHAGAVPVGLEPVASRRATTEKSGSSIISPTR